jgi:small subunit ribosomal protein S19e
MADIRSVEAGKYNLILANAIKESGDFEKPVWVDFVKSGSNKMRPINDPDFWYKRAASILRQLYIVKLVGVQRLRTRYGGRKKRGMPPAEFRKSSGKIIRLILQQAEKAGLVETVKGKEPGRKLTAQGKKFMEDLI